MSHDERIKEIVDSLNAIFERIKKGQSNPTKEANSTFLTDLEEYFDICNKALRKGDMISTPGLDFGKALLSNSLFKDGMDVIIQITGQHFVDLRPDSDIDYARILFKYAELITNQHYALLISAPQEPDLARAAFLNCEMAVHIMNNANAVLQQKGMNTPALKLARAELLSTYFIPALHFYIRLLTGTYGEVCEDQKYRLKDATQYIKKLDKECIDILKRPEHMSIAIVDRTALQKIAHESQDAEALYDCAAKLEAYKTQYPTVWDNGTIYDWSNNVVNLMAADEAKGQCLLKVAEYGDAYQTFERVFECATKSNNEARAGWARYHQALVVKAACAAGITTLSAPEWTIKVLLLEAQTKESSLKKPSWARTKIAKELALIETTIGNQIIKETELAIIKAKILFPLDVDGGLVHQLNGVAPLTCVEPFTFRRNQNDPVDFSKLSLTADSPSSDSKTLESQHSGPKGP